MTTTHRARSALHQHRKPALSLLSVSLMLAFSPAYGVTLDVATAGSQWTYSTVISGADSVLKTGLGILAFTSANTYTGGTTISAGVLRIGNGGTTGSIVGNIMNNAALIFDRSNYMEFAGNINGSGSLTKLGASTLVLTGNNSYTGGTTVSGGWLYVGDSLTKGYIVGNVTNNARLSFYNTGNSFAGVISGNGHVEKSGVGTLALTNAHTYTGGTTIRQGTLVIGAGGTTGSIVGNITITNTATLAFNRLGSTSFAGVVSGSGRLIKAGSNTLTLTGNNAHTGVTTIQGGTLQIGNGGTTGSIAGSVANAGAVVFNRSDSSSLAGAISGNGSLTKLGAGTLTLTGANTYSGGTTLTSGTLQVGNGGTTGSLTGNIANAGAVVFNRSDSSTFAGIVSGSGSLTKLGAGTLILKGANTYSGGTTISGGTLEIGLYGRVNGNIVNNGVLAFNAQNTGTTAIVDGVVSGSGSLLKSGGGDGTHTVVLTGANTYTGGTTISAGVLSIGNGGTTGSIAGNVVNNATLTFNRSDDTSFAGLISGSGGLAQSGAGMLTLGGTSTYTGSTSLSGGTLQLAGALNGTSGVSVAQGATLETDADAGIALGGTGARMDVAGVLTPGGTGAGQLNLALGAGGKLGFAAGSILSFNLGATPDLIAFDQVGDWLDGSGKATLQLSAVDHGQAYTVFRNASTQNFTFANIAGYDATNYTANFFQSGDDYNLSFSAVPVPEADTYLLMLAGLGLVGYRVQRRRQSVI